MVNPTMSVGASDFLTDEELEELVRHNFDKPLFKLRNHCNVSLLTPCVPNDVAWPTAAFVCKIRLCNATL